ncbi:MAG: penicillin acylase family protein [Chlorobi bacterium]|nr:penicillin acylase family protein [Chlorobiota bacterium]
MEKFKRSVPVIILAAVFVFAAALFSFYFSLKENLPAYDGNFSTNKINGKVEVYRDSAGVPYILASNDNAAAFGLGFVHAQERLFQMDVFRRAAEGKLSEVVGGFAVRFDKMFRTLGLYKEAEKEYAALSPESKAYLDSYVDGINYFIETSRGNWGVEFDLLDYKPEKWKPAHSLSIGKLMAWELNIGWWSEFAFIHIAQKIGVEKASEIFPGYEKETAETAMNIDDSIYRTDLAFRRFFGFEGTHIGSNNWAVNGNLSASGKPIVANDTHLAFQLPGHWFFAALKGDELNAAGFTIPGLPVVEIGKNESIAWTATNLMLDDTDFYLEKLDSSRTHYLLDGEWTPLEITKDTIAVRDSTDYVYKIYRTHRGPILFRDHPYDILNGGDETGLQPVSIRWNLYDFHKGYESFFLMNKAQDWESFNDALKDYAAPGQNFVYADKEGNIGYLGAGKIPLRKNKNVAFIYDGTNSENDWKGYVPFEKSPRIFNPSEYFIATANNQVLKNYPFHIADFWEPSSRIDRITEMLNAKDSFSVDYFARMQNDFKSLYAKQIVPYIFAAFANENIEDENIKVSLRLFENWDFVMNAESQTPAIYSFFFQKLLENIFTDEMGGRLFKEFVFIANVPYRIVEKMLFENNSDWFDDIRTEDIVEDRDFIIRKSLQDAVKELENRYGKNPADWQWGKIHTLTFKHIFHGQNKFADNVLDIGKFKMSGDGTTLFNTEFSFSEPYEVKLGPAMRFIYDFAHPEKIYFTLTAGESGHFLNPFYKNMTQNWLTGKYFTVETDFEKIKKNNIGTIRFTP